MNKRIYIIRHGESESNAGLPSNGPDNIPLTKLGRLQALEIAEKFTERPSLIVFSSFLRTIESATPLINKFPDAPMLSMELHEYRFLSPLNFENTTMSDRKGAVREFWQKCDPDFIHGQEAESFNEFGSRVTKDLLHLINSNHPTIVVFTHSQVVRIMWQYLITGKTNFDKESMLYFRDKMCNLQIANAEIYTITKKGNKLLYSPEFEPESHTQMSFWLS